MSRQIDERKAWEILNDAHSKQNSSDIATRWRKKNNVASAQSIDDYKTTNNNNDDVGMMER